MRKILKTSEIDILNKYISPDMFSRLHANRHICLELEGGAYLLAFHFCDIMKEQTDERVVIFCNPKILIFFCDKDNCRQLIKKIDEKKDNYLQLLDFFHNLTADDVYELEKAENNIAELEEYLLTKEKLGRDIPSKIFTMRTELLIIKRYYEQLSLVTGDLAENENKIFPEDLQKRFIALDRRVDHLLDSVMHLREYITQVREAYQAQMDIEQNQIMKIFTVITSIFLPLTLIVGWYGMNLKMPEFGWSFGYPFVIILSIFVCIACFIIFKRKNWF